MTPTEADREIAAAEIDASSPMTFAGQSFPARRSDEVERVTSTSSVSSTSSEERHTRARRISGVSTQHDLERHPTELSRIQTQRSQHSATVGRIGTRGSRTRSRRSEKPLPPFGAGKPYPPQLPDPDEYVVEFDGPDDPLHAMNWPFRKKFCTALILAYTTFVASLGSSIFSSATGPVAKIYHVSQTVSILGISLYVVGFATGPTLWAPLSELKGRKLPLVIGMFGMSIFSISTATAKDLQTILITRFFAGFFGACPLAVVAAVFSDMFDNRTRGIAITLFSMTVFTAPMLAPFIGGFITTSYLGWRWTEYIVSFMAFLAFGLDLLFMNETYPPQILVKKASELRRRTLNWGIHAKQEEIEIDLKELIQKNLSRPMRLLFGEPIVALLSIYMSFLYGILYLFLTAYPMVFQGVYHMTPGVAGLAFFGMIIGQIFAGITILLQQPWYMRKLNANNGVPIPEWRLPSVIAGGFAFSGGLFWFGWSGYTGQVHWIVPTLSGLLSGFGLASIFLQALNYLVDSYLMFAASAIAGNTFLRSLAGAGFPLFSSYMFKGMGIQWASTLLGCVAAALVPIPIIFYYYGARIRAKSAYAPTFAPRAAVEDESGNETNSDHAVGEKEQPSGVPRKTGDATNAV
ncbi:major facilitator superfamily domain-containing protein [Pseudoneurospora amorphoporcata]|uniref:Major facilitator superfamily domain-containing protein n=1 Tax=Pseudoneurospora amorphoporcata TaxID=241081 RepID=A0AAN6SBW0_9PEZI|nr:major facilitator superfamily domain-containing protein [Pseudoneurospora amorphoporcata]